LEAFVFKARKETPGEASVESVGLEEDESGVHGGGIPSCGAEG